MTATIDLYAWNTPNGRKITIALEEMGLPYTFHPVNIYKGGNDTAEFFALNPNRRIPVITDPEGPDGQPVTIFESGAILLWLARKTGLFIGTTERHRIEVEKWLMWQMGNLGPFSGQAEHFVTVAPKKQPPEALAYGQARYRTETARLYGVLDQRLAQNEFVAGNFISIADFAIFPWMTGWDVQGQDIASFPRAEAWMHSIRNRPAVIRGVLKGADLRSDIIHGGDPETILFGARP